MDHWSIDTGLATYIGIDTCTPAIVSAIVLFPVITETRAHCSAKACALRVAATFGLLCCGFVAAFPSFTIHFE